MRKPSGVLMLATLLTVLSFSQPPEANAQEFFKDKVITFIVGYSAGGSFDLYTRTIARHFSKHVPGNPTVVVPGSVPGVQLPAVVTDSSGITDLSGNSWNVAGSPDRTIEPASGGGPLSTISTQTVSAGFANTLDAGDRIVIDFNQAITLALNAFIRITDSDCGAVTQAGPATCSGGQTNTVADIVCGSNAICTIQNGPNGTNTELVITMTGNPSVVAPGSTAGAQFPALITDSSGVTGAGPWNLPNSPDRAFGPQGQ